MFSLISNALAELCNLYTIITLIGGVCMGIIGGMLPGITPSMTIALLLPISLYMPTIPALVMLLGSYEGAMFGGSVSAILINTPGTASGAAAALDGYPMALQGKAGKALRISLYSSCSGGVVGVIILLFTAQFLAQLAIKFGPPELFGLMLLSLTLIAGVSGKSLIKGICSASIGLLVAAVGMDPINGIKRFTFGNINLYDGFALLPVFIGIFALSEIITQLQKNVFELDSKTKTIDFKENKLTFAEFWSQKFNILYSGVIGCFIGSLPGIGGSTACFMAYAESQRRSKYPEKYGTGIIDGVAAPEAANNGLCGGALIPMLTLGIPGDVVTAILLGAFIAQGIMPGPLLFTERINEVYALYVGLLVAIIFLAIIGTLGIPLFSRILTIKKSVLFPAVLIMCVVGTYSYHANLFDCFVMVGFGLLGYYLRKFHFPLPPLVIAFVVGSKLETSFRQSLIISNQNYSIFFTRPISAVLIISAIMFSVVLLLRKHKLSKKDSLTNN